ncbi:MAG: glycosyl transferase, partial [Hyphomicrobiales bacterium]
MSNKSDIRLLQVIVGEPQGGAERFFVKLAGAFSAASKIGKTNITQKLVIARDEARNNDLKSLGCDVTQLDFGSGPADWMARIKFRQILRQYQPTIVMAWMSRAARRVPKGNYIRMARFGGYYPLRHYKGFDHIICNTPDLVRHVRDSGWSQNSVQLISNFGELESQPALDRASLNTSPEDFVIYAAGRFHPMKGFDTLLDAVALVPKSVLWLAGSGELEQDLREQAARLGIEDRVRFLGWRDDQAALYAACDVCVVPSRHEPLSNVVVEAWSQKTPVIAIAAEGPSWLLSDEKSGIL